MLMANDKTLLVLSTYLGSVWVPLVLFSTEVSPFASWTLNGLCLKEIAISYLCCCTTNKLFYQQQKNGVDIHCSFTFPTKGFSILKNLLIFCLLSLITIKKVRHIQCQWFEDTIYALVCWTIFCWLCTKCCLKHQHLSCLLLKIY